MKKVRREDYMSAVSGINHKKNRLQNKMLILKLIASENGISRVELSKKTGLTKMTISNLINSLIEDGLVEEDTETPVNSSGFGRNPIMLRISSKSPCICGILIKRGRCQIILGDLSGQVFDSEILENFKEINAEKLIEFIKNGFTRLKERNDRRILAIGISCIGPVNGETGVILNPPFFHDIKNLPLAQIMKDYTQLPTFLINDGNAGALAELMYGSGKGIINFAYIHIMHGIGSGFVLQGNIYEGDIGQSGEIGHSTINFSGPKCNCGNTGCLELYANINNVRKYVSNLALFYPSSPLSKMKEPSLLDVVDAANQEDFLAVSALEEYLGYVAHAMTSIINFLDLSYIIVDYSSTSSGTVLEDLLYRKIMSSVYHFSEKDIHIVRSRFKGEAPLIGSLAVVAKKVFENQLQLQ